MTLQIINPPSLPKPASRYAQAVLVEGAKRWLHVSGQVGLDATGKLAADQHAQAFANVLAALKAGGMGVENLVKITVYVTGAAEVAAYRGARDGALQGREVASTLVIVAGLVHPDFTVEIEAIAAA
jgi:enamine deaminase RidA (YjgF/YER057c/UK114 family)